MCCVIAKLPIDIVAPSPYAPVAVQAKPNTNIAFSHRHLSKGGSRRDLHRTLISTIVEAPNVALAVGKGGGGCVSSGTDGLDAT